MKQKVLMVCLGNICRSPLAEGILQNKVDPSKVFVDSAGTGSWHVGNSPDPRSITVASKYGIDISNQTCRQFSKNDFDNFDVIYVMDQNNYNNVISQTKNEFHISKVKLLLSEIESNILEVPDPYHDTEKGFENVYWLIDNACQTISKKLLLKTI